MKNCLLLVAVLLSVAACQTVQECPTDGRMMKCTITEAPVCGVRVLSNGKHVKETFANYCTACSLGKVEFTVEGKCSDYPAKATFCSPHESQAEYCTREYQPHCGQFNKNVLCLVPPCVTEGSNRCETCSIENVLYTIKGNCN